MKKFEDRLERLEEITEKIRDAEVPLEKALSLFEEGIRLAKGLEKDIEKIEGKIEVLLNQPVLPEEKPELDLFASAEKD
ncbi:exodeoxyribonuclease VII small subunit [Treponema pedis]|uniref:Exodeoxyribonuclease 7 small subunit n=2 Tax=Treponema pedis TaxID=409322 RepID=S6A0R4_9SPIR|nr:exodeoxyribonuclease VII small subunit [Treponema pedis]AGT44323.1 exodeoxyribonuclease VII small subunit [Treponema pedis str. T A4]QOW62077.1 exodeoxyribonuclease VII small subunit [Treponema pedis]QSI05021.1 exodeoxyribonuclease VII small subunit [Treponema pedis]